MRGAARRRLGPAARGALLALLLGGPVVALLAALVTHALGESRSQSFESSALGETRSVLVLVPEDLSGADAEAFGRVLRNPGRLEAVIVDAEGGVSRSTASIGLADVPAALRASRRATTAAHTVVDGSPYLVTGGETRSPGTDVYLFFSERRLQQEQSRTGTLVVAVAALLVLGLVAGGWWGSHRRLRSVARIRRRERDFTAHLAHELRTPVGALVTAASLVDEPGLRGTPDRVREPVAAMQSEARRLRRLVEDLLELSRLETGQVEARPETVDVVDIARSTVDAFGWDGVRLEGDPAAEAWVDRQSLVRLLANLLANAVRHAREETVVRVLEREDSVLLEIADDGPGMSAAQVDRLTGRDDSPASGPTSPGGGHGFGLSIARAHAALLRVRLEVETDGRRGTVVRTHLPALRGEHAPTTTVEAR